MRISVFGAGAVGGHFAARLAAGGHDVSAVARGPNLAALRAGGIALREGERTLSGRVRASDNAADLGAQGFIFPCMSKILDQLKQAEVERQRIVAERKRLEAEADAAQAAREREEEVQRTRASAPPPNPDAAAEEKAARLAAEGRAAADAEATRPAPYRRLGLALALVVAGAVILFYAFPDRKVSQPPQSEKAEKTVKTFELKLDRNAEGFAARVREKERE